MAQEAQRRADELEVEMARLEDERDEAIRELQEREEMDVDLRAQAAQAEAEEQCTALVAALEAEREAAEQQAAERHEQLMDAQEKRNVTKRRTRCGS